MSGQAEGLCDAPVMTLEPEEVVQSALAKARESTGADPELIQILADHLVAVNASESSVEATVKAIEELANKRASALLNEPDAADDGGHA